MVTERERRYAQAIAVALANLSALPGWLTTPALGRDMRPLGDAAAQRVMAVADAEQAELRAEVRTYHDRAMASEAAEAGWQERADAAEAKVARVEAAIADLSDFVYIDDIRAALDGAE